MPLPGLIEGRSKVGEAIVCLARLARTDGVFPSVAGFVSASYTVTDSSTFPAQVIVPATALSPLSSYFFDYPILDTDWDQDTIGYNFKLNLPLNLLATANHAYVVTVNFIAGDGSNPTVVFRNITDVPT